MYCHIVSPIREREKRVDFNFTRDIGFIELKNQLQVLKSYVKSLKGLIIQSKSQNLVIDSRTITDCTVGTNTVPITAPIVQPVYFNYHSEIITKEFDRILRNIPTFKGGSDENFESWMLVAEQALELGINCTEQQKLNSVMLRVECYAREVL